MQVEVGTALHLKGRNYICIEIQQVDTTYIAKEDYSTMKTWLFAGANVQYIQHEHCDFLAGDIIHHTGERLQLECPGVDLLFIWTKSKIEKVEKETTENEQQRVEDEFGKGTDYATQSTGKRDPGREGDGAPNTGEVGGELHRYGSGGEGGNVVHSEDSEGCKPAVAIDGNSSEAR